LPPGAQVEVLDALDILVQAAKPFGESQMRTIKGKAVSVPFGLSLKRPLDQGVGVDGRGGSKRPGGKGGVFDALLQGLDHLRVAVDVDFKQFRPAAQLRADAVVAQSLANDVVFTAEEVLADVAQEVEMADEVRRSGKHLVATAARMPLPMSWTSASGAP